MQPFFKQRQSSLLFNAVRTYETSMARFKVPRSLQKIDHPTTTGFGIMMQNTRKGISHNPMTSLVSQMPRRSFSSPADSFEDSAPVAVKIMGLPFRCRFEDIKQFFGSYKML